MSATAEFLSLPLTCTTVFYTLLQAFVVLPSVVLCVNSRDTYLENLESLCPFTFSTLLLQSLEPPCSELPSPHLSNHLGRNGYGFTPSSSGGLRSPGQLRSCGLPGAASRTDGEKFHVWQSGLRSPGCVRPGLQVARMGSSMRTRRVGQSRTILRESRDSERSW